MTARRSEIQVEYLPGRTGGAGGATSGEDVTRDLVPFVEAATYTDHARGEADAAELRLSDRDGRFSGRPVAAFPDRPAWPFARGSRFRLGLLLLDWEGPGLDVLLPWGTFELDEVKPAGGELGTAVTLRMQSAAVLGSGAGFREARASRRYPVGSTLAEVCADVAGRHGLGLEFLAADVPFGRPVDQVDEPDASFLTRLCDRAGAFLSVREAGENGPVRLVVSDEPGLADQEAVVVRPDRCSSWSFVTAVHGRFKAATCSYFDPRKGEVVEATAKSADWTDSAETLRVQATVASEAEALRVAAAALRGENRAGQPGNVRLAPGLPGARAGSVVEAEGFGLDDGRYLVDRADHAWAAADGYTTSLALARLP